MVDILLGQTNFVKSQTVMFGIIIVLSIALTGIVVYMFTTNSQQPSTVIAKTTPNNFQGITRTYYIAADEVKWNYAPSGMNMITGTPLSEDSASYRPSVYTTSGKDRIGSTYLKCLYQEYTDDTFSVQKPKQQWLGILGPVIHAEVGDTIKVVFKNNCRFPESMHPHGVFYDKADEGASYNDGIPDSDKPGDAVPTGGNFTYIWKVPERAGPGSHDYSSVLWTYHSHVDTVADTYAGLIGPIIITRQGEANPDGTPKDVDKEFVTMYSVMNENNSPYIDHNIETFTTDPSSVDKDDEDFQESNLMHSINGYVFGNLPGLVMKANTHVRWYVIGLGTEVDLHTPHWHGNTLLTTDGMRTDMVELLPMSMKVLDMYPDDVGTWLYHCHVDDHITAGMLALYTVEPNNGTQSVDTSITGNVGNLKVSLSTSPKPSAGESTQLKIGFLDSKTNSFEQHVDYKISITNGSDQTYNTSLLHTSDGTVTIPYQFPHSGTYHVTVKVDGILFLPTSQTADFTVNVGTS